MWTPQAPSAVTDEATRGRVLKVLLINFLSPPPERQVGGMLWGYFMAWNAAGKLLSGLVMGAAVGATVALVLSSRASVALPHASDLERGGGVGPTPFQPANEVILRARALVDEVRSQVREAVREGKETAARTRLELTQNFEAAKHGERRRNAKDRN
jgi:gas vesicle protein